MPQLSQRSTIYFDPDMHKALRLKAAEENRSISEIVNEAIAMLTAEDAEDIADYDARTSEPGISYADFVKSLKADGIL
ncbi:MAG: CopG family transcriptional regulator [Alphaproteobacteria bacterium]|nr:CopG family transcriptional regulator [Alphaproteobacteria bacterium]